MKWYMQAYYYIFDFGCKQDEHIEFRFLLVERFT